MVYSIEKIRKTVYTDTPSFPLENQSAIKQFGTCKKTFHSIHLKTLTVIIIIVYVLVPIRVYFLIEGNQTIFINYRLYFQRKYWGVCLSPFGPLLLLKFISL